MRVLGLDPGTERTGYGCVEHEGRTVVRLGSGVLDLGRGPLGARLVQLYEALTDLFESLRPESCALEGVFFHRAARSALILGHARGVCLLAAASRGVPVTEYAPAAVKRSITGNGAAKKHQVGYMVEALLGWKSGPLDDETDALAIALCHLETGKPLRVVQFGRSTTP